MESDEERIDAYINHEAAGNGQFDSPANLSPPGVAGSKSHFATRATAAITIPVGTWTIAVSSDDGMRLTTPGIEYTNKVGENVGSAIGPRSDELIAGSIRNGTTFGTFTVSGAPFETTLQLDHFNFFSGSYVELSIASGAQTSFDANDFTILQDGTLGWGVQAAEVVLDKVDFALEIDSDVSGQMLNNNSSAYIRYPFNLTRGSGCTRPPDEHSLRRWFCCLLEWYGSS